jgi:hypothetical protein
MVRPQPADLLYSQQIGSQYLPTFLLQMQRGKLPIEGNPTLHCHWQCHYTVFYKVTKTTCTLLKVLVPIQKNTKQENQCNKVFLIGITTLPSNALAI